MKMNLFETASCFGVTKNTIKSWVAAGCPVDQKGGQSSPWVLDSGAVMQWRETVVKLKASSEYDQTDLEEARRLKMAAEGAIARIRLNELHNTLVPTPMAKEVVHEHYSLIRKRINLFKERVCRDLCLDQRQRKIVVSAINEALAELNADREVG